MYKLTALLLSFFFVTACSSIIGESPTPPGADAQHRNEQLRSDVHALKKAVNSQQTRLTTPLETNLWLRITFDSGRTFVDEPTHKTLHALAAKYLAAPRNQRLIVQGFCDNEPIGGYDGSHKPPAHHYHSLLALSEARADTVAEILMQSGIPHEVIRIQAFGASHFIDNNKSDRGRENNRRVDVFLVNQP